VKRKKKEALNVNVTKKGKESKGRKDLGDSSKECQRTGIFAGRGGRFYTTRRKRNKNCVGGAGERNSSGKGCL